jgi:hypothetical protein
MSRISSVAYAFEDSGSLQNTGNASLFGSSVLPNRSLRSGRPTSNRFGNSRTFMAPAEDLLAREPSILTPS